MKALSYEKIYKMYKHGASLKDIPKEDLFNALKKNKIQAVLVYDKNNNECVYVFYEDENRFYKII
jgi:hypothetical protein